MGAARLPVVYVITGEEDEGLNCVEIPAPGPRVAVADLLAHLPAPPPACDWFLSLAGGRFQQPHSRRGDDGLASLA